MLCKGVGRAGAVWPALKHLRERDQQLRVRTRMRWYTVVYRCMLYVEGDVS